MSRPGRLPRLMLSGESFHTHMRRHSWRTLTAGGKHSAPAAADTPHKSGLRQFRRQQTSDSAYVWSAPVSPPAAVRLATDS